MKSKKSKFKVHENIIKNKYLLIVAICFLIYSIIETLDCASLLLISFNLIPNIYLSWNLINVKEVHVILENQPILFFPFFLSFTLMRIFSTIGILKNLSWGLYLGFISLILTMIFTTLFMPLGFFELLFCTILLIFLLMGYFGEKKIIA